MYAYFLILRHQMVLRINQFALGLRNHSPNSEPEKFLSRQINQMKKIWIWLLDALIF